MNELAVSAKEHPPMELLSRFSRFKDKLMEPQDVPPPRYDEDRTAYELYGRYQDSLRRQNAMDFAI
jgi:superfamily I DNA/RNA helicase